MMMMVTNIGEQLYAVAEERETMSELIRLYGHVEDYEIQVVTRSKETIWVSPKPVPGYSSLRCRR